MNDKDKTNYLRRKLVDMKESATSFGTDTENSNTNQNAPEKKTSVVNKFFHTVFTFLAFYGSQYIILNKYVSPNLTLNFFEAGVIFLCLTTLIGKRS